MTDLEYRIQLKNRAIEELSNFFTHESYWLTPDDIRAIEVHIDKLSKYIDERYYSHGSIEQRPGDSAVSNG